jgi:hypothetical protein
MEQNRHLKLARNTWIVTLSQLNFPHQHLPVK